MTIDKRVVRIEYWEQETTEAGRWLKTEPMTYDLAENLIALGAYYRASIVSESQCQFGKDVGMPEYSCSKSCQYAQPDHTKLIGELVEALETIGQRFVSGNDVPVSRATVPAEEWANVDALLTKAREAVK